MAMEKVFVEYAIEDESIASYRTFMSEKRSGGEQFDWYQGTDQPGLFVEIWSGLAYDAYQRLKRKRTDAADPDWGQLQKWVRGGLGKVHVWHFTNLSQ